MVDLVVDLLELLQLVKEIHHQHLHHREIMVVLVLDQLAFQSAVLVAEVVLVVSEEILQVQVLLGQEDLEQLLLFLVHQ
jgi:hypothetical protein